MRKLGPGEAKYLTQVHHLADGGAWTLKPEYDPRAKFCLLIVKRPCHIAWWLPQGKGGGGEDEEGKGVRYMVMERD